MPAPSYESDLAVFMQLLEGERENLWAQADWALHMTATYGRKTAKTLAADSGLSASYVRQLVATAKVFPDDSRAQDLRFTHHRMAAMTTEPEMWLQHAMAEAMSVKELRQAITASRDRISEAEQARRAAERLASVFGQAAIIRWEPIALSKQTAQTPPAARSA